MKAAVWSFFGFLAALWSLLAWLLHGIAGSGSAAVVSVSRWLSIDPSRTQWIADGLAAAGWLAQALVVLLWLMGMALLLLFGWLGSRAAEGVGELGEEMRRSPAVRGGGEVVEGEVALRRVGPHATRDEGPARLG
ncbi:MAG: hypothetical protein ACK5SX_07470 [Sandaracinobacter sp.]